MENKETPLQDQLLAAYLAALDTVWLHINTNPIYVALDAKARIELVQLVIEAYHEAVQNELNRQHQANAENAAQQHFLESMAIR